MIGEWKKVVRMEPAIEIALVTEKNEASILHLISFAFAASKYRYRRRGRKPRRQDGEQGSMRKRGPSCVTDQKSAVMFWSLRRNNRVGMVITADQTCT